MNLTNTSSRCVELTCGDLVSEASAAAVDHHTHLTFVVDAHLLGGVVVVDLIHHLDLGIVVSCSQSPQLQHTHTHTHTRTSVNVFM